MQTQDLFFSSTVIGLAVIVALIGALLWLKKKTPEKTIGEIINFIFLREKISFIVVGTIFINVAEAIFAASIHPEGETAINPTARFVTHLVVSMVSIVLGLSAIAAISRIAKVEGNKTTAVITAFTFLFGAIALPSFNLILIASGLKELDKLEYAFQGHLLESMQYMSYAMNASMVLTVTHFVMLFMDSITVASGDAAMDGLSMSGLGFKAKASEIDKKITKKGEEEQSKANSSPESNIKFILNAYRLPGAELSKRLESALKKKDSLSNDKLKATLAESVSNLKKEVMDLQASKANKAEDERKEINGKIYKKIYDFWKQPHTTGKGFGEELPKKESSGN